LREPGAARASNGLTELQDQSLSLGQPSPYPSRATIELGGALLALAVAGTLARYLIFLLVTGEGSAAAFIEAACAWDCGWYKGIIADGYGEPGSSLYVNRAFFPLFPALAGGLHQLTGLTIAASGFAASTLFTLAAALVARHWFGANRHAWWLFAFSLFLGPFSVLLATLYTEALFILLSILALNAINRQRWLAAGCWVALLSATRVTGVLMGLAIVAGFVVAHLAAQGSFRTLIPAALRTPRLLLGLLVAPLGLLGYMAFLALDVGDPLAFLHVQSSWNRHLQSPLGTLVAAVSRLWTTDLAEFTDVAAHWALLVGIGLTALLARRGRIPEAAFCGALILISMIAGSGSMLRFVAGAAPLGMLLCELLAGRPGLRFAAYPVIAALGVLGTMSWFAGSTLLV
jgi:hypothetical protein